MLRIAKLFIFYAFLFTLIHLCHMSGLETKMACENETLSLTCEHEPNRVIEITSSYYGRFSKKPCNPERKNFRVTCSSPNASHIIGDLWDDFHQTNFRNLFVLCNFFLFFYFSSCNGKSACEMIANKDTFGDPCQEVVHVLEINYECVESNFRILNHF